MRKRGLIVGFGNMGALHAREFAALGADIIAVVDPDDARRHVAQEAGFLAFSSFADIPESTLRAADFLVIATPTDVHARALVEAHQIRVPVLVEKPVVRTAQEVQWLLDFAASGPPLFVAEVEQYNPAFAPLLGLTGHPLCVRMERLVDLEYFLRGERPWFLQSAKSGGVVLDVMVHDISLLVLTFGRPRVGMVRAEAGRYSRADGVEAELLFDGFTATLYANWSAEGQKVPISASATVLLARGQQPLVMACDQYLVADKPRHLDPYAIQAGAFLQVVRGKKPAPSVTPYVEAVQVALEINHKIGVS